MIEMIEMIPTEVCFHEEWIPRVWERTQSKKLVNQHLVPSDVRGSESLDHQKHIAIQFYAPPTHLYTHVSTI